jgi:hypothetical protein
MTSPALNLQCGPRKYLIELRHPAPRILANEPSEEIPFDSRKRDESERSGHDLTARCDHVTNSQARKDTATNENSPIVG